MDAKLIDDKWVLSIPVAANYRVKEAAWILGSGIAWVASREMLRGPASTPVRPIDHDALARCVGARDRKHRRVRARAQLKRLLEVHLGG